MVKKIELISVVYNLCFDKKNYRKRKDFVLRKTKRKLKI